MEPEKIVRCLATTRQTRFRNNEKTYKNRGIPGIGVFYAVRAEVHEFTVDSVSKGLGARQSPASEDMSSWTRNVSRNLATASEDELRRISVCYSEL
jgi:hypothetical protein